MVALGRAARRRQQAIADAGAIVPDLADAADCALITQRAALAVIFQAAIWHPLPRAQERGGGIHDQLVASPVAADDIGDNALALHVHARRAAANDLDAFDTGGRDSLQDCGDVVVLGGGPRTVNEDVARRSGKAAHCCRIVGVERKPRQALDHVIGGRGPGLGEEVGLVDRYRFPLRRGRGIRPGAEGRPDRPSHQPDCQNPGNPRISGHRSRDPMLSSTACIALYLA